MSNLRATAARHVEPPRLQVSSRASWSGQLVLGRMAVAVKAYPALVTPSNSLLHQVHADCGKRIEYRKTCPQHGEVAPDDIVKAYSVTPDDDVLLTPADLAALRPTDDRSIQIERLVPGEKIDLVLLSGRSLYLVPANSLAGNNYALFAAALSRSGAWAVAQMILSEHRQLVVIRPHDGLLVMHILHWPALRRACPAFAGPTDEIPAERIRALEKSLARLRRTFSWHDYVDSFEHDLTHLVSRKIARREKSIHNRSETGVARAA